MKPLFLDERRPCVGDIVTRGLGTMPPCRVTRVFQFEVEVETTNGSRFFIESGKACLWYYVSRADGGEVEVEG